MKQCSSWHLELSLAAFGRRSASRDGLNPRCRECVNEYQRANRKRYPSYQAQLAADTGRWDKYKLTPERCAELLDQQGGGCAICREPLDGQFWVDHDHKCCPGKRACGECNRGLLCRNCNLGLGFFDDNESRLAAAINYLRWKV